MNCKPGDLAVMVSADVPEDVPYIGRIFTRVRIQVGVSEEQGYPIWVVAEMNDAGVADRALRPIRDPGDDAKDETLEWLPVPSKERETT